MANQAAERWDEGAECDREMLEEALRANLTPEGATAVSIWLQEKLDLCRNPPTSPGQKAAWKQVAWLAAVLRDMVGHAEFARILDDECF